MSTPPAKPPSAMQWLQRTRKVLQEEIWHHKIVFDQTARGRYYAFLRVLSITFRGVLTKKMFSQAAALSYASLMSLGPIVSLAIMLSTIVLQNNSEEFTTNLLHQIVTFIAPSTSIAEQQAVPEVAPASNDDNNPPANSGTPLPATTATTPAATTPAPGPADVVPVQPNQQLVDMIKSFVDSAHSRTIGVFGLVVLVFICIQMMVSIETNFNNIWGVRRGRDILRRIILYGTVFTLGVLAAFTTAVVLSAATWGKFAKDQLPAWGRDILGNFTGATHLIAFLLLTVLLAVFYRFIPNTRVRWGPALLGGMVVATGLILNNYLSFLYVSMVLNRMSLYGSVGIIPILMFGLYVFWTMVLFGGLLTYAVQNVNNITADRLWNQVSPRTRRLLNLAAFLQIARASLRQQPGPTSEELANILRVPAAILNEGLGRMMDLKLVSLVEVTNAADHVELRYQPNQPLHQLTLGAFHHDLDIVGNTAGDETLLATDALVPAYLAALTEFESGPALNRNFADLLARETAGGAPA
jgi:membrane protein